ncbi:ComEC/Rec2 family competence protein [Patescibacteria group bacterium]|nr:ComEC/Rec2 family competence protein [Patescibacteria group bacterium]
MLVRNPYYLLYDLGFIFSFSAVIGLVYFSERWKITSVKKVRQGSVRKSIVGLMKSFRNVYVLPSLSASLAVSAPLLFFTSRVNLLSIVSNILVVPLVPFVMIYGFLAALFYTVFRWQFIILPQKRAVERIYMVNTRSVNHALSMNALS